MLKGVAFPKTHDLEYLIVLAEKHSIAMEPELESASWADPPGPPNSATTTRRSRRWSVSERLLSPMLRSLGAKS